MTLVKYKEKRLFNKTPEPTGGKSKAASLRYVIQKHAASRLHYDFRLEMDGVLKSWAIPKGPSTDPAVKRLAMMVEDHPYDYKDFEGIIPDGNYGAGTVMVWDEGTYEPIEPVKGRDNQEKKLLKELQSGSLKFILHGKKLKGEFALVKTKGMADNSWLLIKHLDKFASDENITEMNKSVVSGKDLDKITATSENIYGSDEEKESEKEEKPESKTVVKKKLKKQIDPDSTEVPEADIDVEKVLKRTKKEKFPAFLTPMLATLVDKPFDDPGWEYEVKWDGYRALAFLNKSETELRSRNNKSFNDKFYPVFNAVKNWGIEAVIDGEIVVVDDKGISNFNSLQNWRSEADGQLLYYVFDVLWLNGRNLMELTLKERKAILQTLIPEDGIIKSGFSMDARGAEFFKVAKTMGLEGIIAKRSDSVYYPGDRSKNWLKIKVQKRQEVVIAGYTRNKGTSKLFSALLLGAYQDGKLRYVGKVGTGFNNKQQKEILTLFKPLTTKKSPFEQIPDYNKPSRFRPNPPDASATWLEPKLVCEINFAEITEEGVFRHPSFVAMREDKDPKDVVKEIEVPTEEVVKNFANEKEMVSIIKTPEKSDRKTLLNPTEKSQAKKVNGRELKFTNLDKIFWPDEKISKRDMLNYYYQVAPYILPYLKNRPQSLNRFPNGITGSSFYQKDVTGKVPDWVEQFPYRSNDDDQEKNYMLCNDEASLLLMVNMGAIEINPWSSTVQKPDNPDWCILDLDPDKTNTFEQVIETANVIKEILDNVKVASYCKTSGSTGIHIYIPLGAKYDYDQSQLFAKWVASSANETLPDFTSIERMTKNRKGKLYIDYLQNHPAATLAAPYSLRPKPGATVSMPLHWTEVKKGLQMKDFTIVNALERIKSEGDIFKPVLEKGIDLEEISEQL
ncbi:DNA ligase D [Dyadobacter frigoris]|uniref:DNA ligase (ATP) n=1 Tax=Dyadobacter frigoris TaxID=2576211 RepID=A0A4U6D8D4_9BACT|nr:DNA ligase D [Dyadobacter frigoris]TKT90424.1 DNA ligase D [Dyadobacter frigoris]GLU51454.1 ATP-dependent DNA ligase [Dyadobacter frigoris]